MQKSVRWLRLAPAGSSPRRPPPSRGAISEPTTLGLVVRSASSAWLAARASASSSVCYVSDHPHTPCSGHEAVDRAAACVLLWLGLCPRGSATWPWIHGLAPPPSLRRDGLRLCGPASEGTALRHRAYLGLQTYAGVGLSLVLLHVVTYEELALTSSP